tara:strand:+ start:5981 stop:6274 length:294 start_codon:yes stop_codon:yes gene_type:complete
VKTTKNISVKTLFPKHLFWDMDINMLQLKEDKDIIIPRALFFTSEKEFEKDITTLELYFSKSEILNILKTTKETISNDICKLVASRYSSRPFLRFNV